MSMDSQAIYWEKHPHRSLYYKTFYGRNLRIFVISYKVCPFPAFQPSLVFAGKAGAYLSEAPFRCSTLG